MIASGALLHVCGPGVAHLGYLPDPGVKCKITGLSTSEHRGFCGEAPESPRPDRPWGLEIQCHHASRARGRQHRRVNPPVNARHPTRTA